MGESQNAQILFQVRGVLLVVAVVITIKLSIISKRHAPFNYRSAKLHHQITSSKFSSHKLFITSKRHTSLLVIMLTFRLLFVLLGVTLTGHTISVHQTRSELDCAHKCHSNSNCASFNFEFQSSRTLSTCEINGMSRTLSGPKLQSRDGFAYYEPTAKLTQEKDIDSTPSPAQQGKIVFCEPIPRLSVSDSTISSAQYCTLSGAH